jgi:hypothetical protein
MLDGKDLDNHGKHVIPTLSELEKYIRAKQNIFSKKIEQRKRAALRQTRRNILSNIQRDRVVDMPNTCQQQVGQLSQ